LLESTKELIAKKSKERKNPYNYPVGITAYSNFFTDEELKEIEQKVEDTEKNCENRAFLPMTA
jgi:hypothetical protein